MSVFTENLMKALSTGYGGGSGYSPYNVHAALLAQGQESLNTRKMNEAIALQREALGLEKEKFQESKETEELNRLLSLVSAGADPRILESVGYKEARPDYAERATGLIGMAGSLQPLMASEKRSWPGGTYYKGPVSNAYQRLTQSILRNVGKV